MLFPRDRFLRYDELSSLLHQAASAHPALATVESIGQSHEGRELWLVTITDTATGAHHDKPAMWVDANIHATEVTGSVAALALIDTLLSGFGSDPVITEALRSRTFYVVPRVNPDGAELALGDQPRYLRSSTRPWPWSPSWTQPGLHRQDVNGDGRVLSMRIADPTGGWMTHPDEPRLMVPVPPNGTDRPRYRMLDEGVVEDFDGYTVPLPAPPADLDLNRNYPAGWGIKVSGSGDYPGSEPEIAALLRAITARPNVCGANAYHTHGGMLLQPCSTRPDGAPSRMDRWTWGQLGAIGTKLTGYPMYSEYSEFTMEDSHSMTGTSDDWAFEHLGVFSWTTEFWDAVKAATGTPTPTTSWVMTLEPEVELAVLRWFDEHHPGAYVDWAPFEHPQLGAVEIGGWDAVWSWVNPPLAALAAEVEPHPHFAIAQAMASPKLAIERVEAEALGGGRWRVRAGIANTGWLPTNVTDRAAKLDLVRPVVAELVLPDGAVVDGGPNRQLLGQLQGSMSARFGEHNDGTPNRALVSWVVRATGPLEVGVVASHQRAGTARATVRLD